MRLSRSLWPQMIAIAELTFIHACRGTTPSSTETRLPAVTVDSAEAVRLAIAALRKGSQPPYAFQLSVDEFTRDSVGYLIVLVPARGSGIEEGGGGQVRISYQGEVREVIRSQ